MFLNVVSHLFTIRLVTHNLIAWSNFFRIDKGSHIATGLGALESTIRWDYAENSQFLSLANGTYGTNNNLTLGLNWYWNPYARCMFNYTHVMPHTNNGDGHVLA